MKFATKLSLGCIALLSCALGAAGLLLTGQSFSGSLANTRTALQAQQEKEKYALERIIFQATDSVQFENYILASAAQQYAEQTADAGTVFVTGDGMEKRDLISYRNDYQILTEGSRSGLANCNYQSGEVGYLNAAADSFTPVADGFPTTRAGWECYYSLTGFADGWLVWVDECGCDENGNGTGDNTTRQYFCRNGVKTELTQQRYVPGKDVRNIRILDAQQGRVLAAYDTKTGTVHDVDKDGTTYTRPMNWDVYGVIALDDLLAGSTDFTPLNFAE